jgi:regulator of RNase E activity RraA
MGARLPVPRRENLGIACVRASGSVGGEVEVLVCARARGDLVHADRHGAVIVPLEWVRALPDAAREVAAREARILAVARGPDCTADKLVDVFRDLDAIH